MKRFFALLFMIITSFNLLAWGTDAKIGITSSEGKSPNGFDHFNYEHPSDNPCLWRDNGIHFAIWMTDIETGLDSDVFYPGDRIYNYRYYPDISEEYGVIIFNFESFKDQGRYEAMELDEGDILHMRIFYDNPATMTREVHSLDTVFTEEPARGSFDYIAKLHPATENDIKTGYDCFSEKDIDFEKYNKSSISIVNLILEDKLNIDYSLNMVNHVEINVIDNKGGIIKNILSQKHKAGKYSTSWDGKDNNGNNVEPGIYFINFICGSLDKKVRILKI